MNIVEFRSAGQKGLPQLTSSDQLQFLLYGRGTEKKKYSGV